MSRILLAWELGGDYGHLMRFITLGQELQRRGHEPIFALRELTHVDTIMRDVPFAIHQAPVWMAAIGGLAAPIGFAETLMHLGFLHPQSLAGLCRGWHALVAAVSPDLLVFDYAPTGLLATRNLGLPRVQFGASFSVPPRTRPMPVYRWWQPEDKNRVAQSERAVLECSNAALARLGEPPMQALADLLDTEEAIIAGLPELDQYPQRKNARYWGDIGNLSRGASPTWNPATGKRIFAYLKPHHRDFEAILRALGASGAAVVVHAPGAPSAALQKAATASLVFSKEPVKMSEVLATCDLVLCHSGVSTVEATLSAGKPLLLLPQHLEQMMTAKRVEELQACVIVDPGRPPPDYGSLLKRLLDDPSFTNHARQFAAHHPNDPAERAAQVVSRLEEILSTYRRVG